MRSPAKAKFHHSVVHNGEELPIGYGESIPNRNREFPYAVVVFHKPSKRWFVTSLAADRNKAEKVARAQRSSMANVQVVKTTITLNP